ncbi:LCP family protein [Ligilactobacillus salivarius]|uniref:LCP family glycopolymer transferase n=1 Tax=Ligilactobacillus salivarius TaxID=1624 RepID=UPI002150890A|nr:LCP family protein [Ligilactobacillus salivarius]MDH4959872.1 LCP family protein [Ligilactobacillus salivarius]UUY23239.1 LCP family protein [Ligilactobacillus salivarius]
MDNEEGKLNRKHSHHKHHHRSFWQRHKIWKWILIVIGLFIVADVALFGKMYFDAKKSANSTYKQVKTNKLRNTPDLNNGKPFTVLILGTDTGEYGRTYQGRSDTMMLAAVSPKEKKTTLVSIPRDTKVAIPGYGYNNKINAAYSYEGTKGAVNIVQSYLDVPVDYYVEMNMKGLEELSAAVGPVKVENDLEFTNANKTFKKGTVTIDEDNILAYTRMRYGDPRGDYGRQLRQRMVLEALVKKIATIGSMTKYQSILNAISSNMKTNLTFDDMKAIATKYSSASKIEQVQLQGESQMIDGVSYEVVPQSNLDKVTSQLKKALNE